MSNSIQDLVSYLNIVVNLEKGGKKFMEFSDKIRRKAAPYGEYPGILKNLDDSLLKVIGEVLRQFSCCLLKGDEIQEKKFCLAIDALCTASLSFSCLYIRDKNPQTFNRAFSTLEKASQIGSSVTSKYGNICLSSGFNIGAYLFKEKFYDSSLILMNFIIKNAERSGFDHLLGKSYRLKALCLVANQIPNENEFYDSIIKSDSRITILYAWISLIPPKNPELVYQFITPEMDITKLLPYFVLNGFFSVIKDTEFEVIYPNLNIPNINLMSSQNLEVTLRRLNELFNNAMYYECIQSGINLLKIFPISKVKPLEMIALLFIYYWIIESNICLERIEISEWYSKEMQNVFKKYPFTKGFGKFLEIKCKIKRSKFNDINIQIPKLQFENFINWNCIKTLLDAIYLSIHYDERCFYYYQKVFEDNNIIIKREAFHYYVTSCRLFSISPDLNSFYDLCQSSNETKSLYLYHSVIEMLKYENINEFWSYHNIIEPPLKLIQMLDRAISYVPCNCIILRRLYQLKALIIGTSNTIQTVNLITSSLSLSIDIYLDKYLIDPHFKIPFSILSIVYINIPGLDKCLLFALSHPYSKPLVVRIITNDKFDEIIEDFDEIQSNSMNISSSLSNEIWWHQKFQLNQSFEQTLTKLESLLDIWNGLFAPLKFSPTQNAFTSTLYSTLFKYPNLKHKIDEILITNNTNKPTIVGKIPLTLILGKKVHKIPWESLKIVNEYQIVITRIPSMKLIALQSQKNIPIHINPKSAFYILNPKGDLQDTENTFQKLFDEFNWKGITRILPNPMDIENAIKTMDLFIYCGHGSGNEYFDYHNLVEKNIHCRATMFLMGCCSGELIDDGEIDPKGVPYYCNIAGSGSVLANLWNVTDKDIDRFLKQLLENMRQSEFCSLEEAVMAARSACKLRYLTGAAPVIYGFPTVIHVPEEVCQ